MPFRVASACSRAPVVPPPCPPSRLILARQGTRRPPLRARFTWHRGKSSGLRLQILRLTSLPMRDKNNLPANELTLRHPLGAVPVLVVGYIPSSLPCGHNPATCAGERGWWVATRTFNLVVPFFLACCESSCIALHMRQCRAPLGGGIPGVHLLVRGTCNRRREANSHSPEIARVRCGRKKKGEK